MDFGATLVGILKALAWPAAVVFLGCVFKPDLTAWLPSILRRKLAVKLPGGIEATVDAEQQQATTDNPAAESLPARQGVAPSPRAAVTFMENKITAELQPIEAATRPAVLVRALALARLEGSHEFIYNRIFGSQIEGLKRLNIAGRASVDDAREFFAPYPAAFPQIYANYGFDGWLSFLTRNALVSQDGVILTVTDIGRDFLVYMTERRLTEAKIG